MKVVVPPRAFARESARLLGLADARLVDNHPGQGRAEYSTAGT
jgi:hypothetical protein